MVARHGKMEISPSTKQYINVLWKIWTNTAEEYLIKRAKGAGVEIFVPIHVNRSVCTKMVERIVNKHVVAHIPWLKVFRGKDSSSICVYHNSAKW